MEGSIKVGLTTFNTLFVLSFETEKDFLQATKNDYYQLDKESVRLANLKAIYKNAKKLENKD